MDMGLADKDFLELVIDLWNQYNSQPLFWLVAAPFILWWANFFRNQLSQFGISQALVSGFNWAKSGWHWRLPERIRITIGWPQLEVKAAYPTRAIRWLTIYLIFVMAMLMVSVGFEIGWFNRDWWTLFGFIFAYCVIWAILTNWRANKTESINVVLVSEAIETLDNFSVVLGRNGFTLAQLFCAVGREMRHSIDFRAMAFEIGKLAPNNRATPESLEQIGTQLADQLIERKLARYRKRILFSKPELKELRLTPLGARVIRELCPRKPREITVEVESNE